MSDLYEPYDKLVSLTVLGRRFTVPDNNLLLRQLQYVAPDVGMGRYCWNGECRYCEVSYQARAGAPEHAGLACRMKGTDGMRLTKLAPEVKYNLSEALAATAPDEP
jgi:hypothetical protein